MARLSLLSIVAALVFSACSTVAFPANRRGTHNQAASHLPYNPQEGGKNPPLFPEEFAFTFVQHKWNENGFGVNHEYGGIWYSSTSRSLVRIDLTSYDWVSDNASTRGVLSGGSHVSIFDFTKVATTGNVTNTLLNVINPLKINCEVDELPVATAVAQIFPPNYLVDNGVYAGEVHISDFGVTDKWVSFFGPVTLSFYFTKEGDWVRFDQNSIGLKTSVITWVFNFVKDAKITDDFFAAVGVCPTKDTIAIN